MIKFKTKQTIKSLTEKNIKLQELVEDMSDYFPTCINCEGKEDGVRTDKCHYLIDDTAYCARRGFNYILDIQRENDSLIKQNRRLAEALNAETMNKNALLNYLKRN